MITRVERKYLEIKSLDKLNSVNKPFKTCVIEYLSKPDFQLNKFFYKQIGNNHRWIDRLSWEEKKWIEYTENKNVRTYVLKDNENLVGYFELIINQERKDCEVAYFGILEEYFGKKYGGYLLSEAIKFGFSNKVDRVWLHTCSLDHENALKNYLNRGMEIFKSETINMNI